MNRQRNPYRLHLQIQQHLHVQVRENLQPERFYQKRAFSVTKTSTSKTPETEKLSGCMQLQTDETVRKIATQKNDSKILAITTKDLIAKEACYHFTCYRSYTRQNKVKEVKAQDEPGQDKTEHSNILEVIKFLVELYKKPDIVPLSTLQNMLSIKSERKNLKRNIENRTSNFKFVKSVKTYLVYPVTLKFEDLVVKWYDANQRINHIEGTVSPQKIITQAASIVKDEIKNLKYQMSCPPKTDELNMSNFINPPNLDSFLLTLLNEGEPETNRVSRSSHLLGKI